MRAVRYTETGGAEKLGIIETPSPQPEAGQALIRVRTAGFNRLDIDLLSGKTHHHKALPHTPGTEMAGEIVALGENTYGFEPGHPVVLWPYLPDKDEIDEETARLKGGFYGYDTDGTLSELIIAPVANLVAMPDNLSFEQAAAQSVSALTAWHMLVNRVGMRPGEWVLVHAAGSGIGSAAIQVARLWGAQVIATVGSNIKIAKAEELGALHVINYQEQEFYTEVMQITGGRGVDVVVEHTGQETWEKSVKCLTPGGRLVICGATTGNNGYIDLYSLYSRQIMLIGSSGGSKETLQEVLQLTDEGRLEAVIDTVYPLEEAHTAVERLLSRDHFGKIMIKM